MCEVLDKVENAGYVRGRDDGLKQGRSEGRRQGRSEGRRQGLKQGRNQGRKEGERQAITVMRFLIEQNRSEDLLRFTEDRDFREELIKELLLKESV